MSKPSDALNVSCLGLADVANFALQRTDLILDWPLLQRKGSFLFWHFFGWRGPLLAEMALRRRAVLDRGAANIHAEFARFRDKLPERPRRICDIGCGLGHLAIYLAEAFPVEEILLIDIEATPHHRHNFNHEGSGYNSLAAARNFVAANVPSSVQIETCNPQRDDWRQHLREPFDLVVSLLSCGHHYPTETYLDLFRDAIRPGGFLLLDMRRAVAQNDLSAWFDVAEVISEDERSQRVLF